jgi:hypothetical protein
MCDEVLAVGPIMLDRASREVTIDGTPVRLMVSGYQIRVMPYGRSAASRDTIAARSIDAWATSMRSNGSALAQ